MEEEMTWLLDAHKQRDFTVNQTTVAAWNNNQMPFSRLPIIWALPHQGHYFATFSLYKIMVWWWRGSPLNANKPHDLCSELSSPRLKINLSCQQHDGQSAPDLYSEQSVCRPGHMQGDLSPCHRHAVTDPPRCQNMRTRQKREKHQLLTDNVLHVTTHPDSPE